MPFLGMGRQSNGLSWMFTRALRFSMAMLVVTGVAGPSLKIVLTCKTLKKAFVPFSQTFQVLCPYSESSEMNSTRGTVAFDIQQQGLTLMHHVQANLF